MLSSRREACDTKQQLPGYVNAAGAKYFGAWFRRESALTLPPWAVSEQWGYKYQGTTGIQIMLGTRAQKWLYPSEILPRFAVRW